MEYVIVDIETTGLSARRHKITEIAALKYKNNKLIDEFVTLVNPECHIPSFITRLTGINDSMVEDAPTISRIIPDFHKFVSDIPFIAHNATFDFNFLDYAIQIYTQNKMSNDKICTARLARRLLPQLPSKRLGYICQHLDITNEAAHRAKGDALATAQVFNHFQDLIFWTSADLYSSSSACIWFSISMSRSNANALTILSIIVSYATKACFAS